jgi:hypothetical protein
MANPRVATGKIKKSQISFFYFFGKISILGPQCMHLIIAAASLINVEYRRALSVPTLICGIPISEFYLVFE